MGLLDTNIRGPFGLTKDCGDPVGGVVHGVEIVAEHLDRDVTAHARDQFVEPHLDRLADLESAAGNAFQYLLDLGHQFGLRQAAVRPLVSGFHDDEGVGDIGRHRISRQFGRAGLGEDEPHFGQLADLPLDAGLHGLALVDRRSRNAQDLRGQVALVELGKELLPQEREGQDRRKEGAEAYPHRHRGALHGAIQARLIFTLEPGHDPSFLLLHRLR